MLATSDMSFGSRGDRGSYWPSRRQMALDSRTRAFSGENRNRGKKKPKRPGLFEVWDTSPPPRTLGVIALPTNTHNGDVVEVAGKSFIVQSVVMQYKLVRGKYHAKYRRLEVRSTGRFLYEEFLEGIYKQ